MSLLKSNGVNNIDAFTWRDHAQAGEQIMAIANAFLLVVASLAYIGSNRWVIHPNDPIILSLLVFCVSSVLRWRLAASGRLPKWASYAAVIIDFTLLYIIIFCFQNKYGQPLIFALKSPTFAFGFVLIALRTMSFEISQIMFAGFVALMGQWGTVAYTYFYSGPSSVTGRYLSEIYNGQHFIGAQFEKSVAILVGTITLAFAVRRGRTFLRQALSEAKRAQLGLERESQLNAQLAEEVAARMAANDKLHRVAYYDKLTGLENRRNLSHRLNAAADAFNNHQGDPFAVTIVDLDRFRSFNDSFGWAIGDMIIIGTAERLTANLVDGEHLARIGADEFAIFSPNITTAEQARTKARRLVELMDEPLSAAGTVYAGGASVGVAIAEQGDDGACVLAYADIALNSAKNKGRRRFAVHNPITRDEAVMRSMLELSFRGALERNEIDLHYQPIVRLADDQLAGWEALMRWTRVDGVSVSPLVFIPIAEETGSIISLGAWALGQATRDAKRFVAAGADTEAFMSVNVSAHQLSESARLHIAVEMALETHAALKLEVTESAIVEDPVQGLIFLEAMRELGAGLSLDDFGTGTSSLSQLRRFPFSTLKIDRSFVQDASVKGRDFLAAIVGLARTLGVETVAEGIETEDDLMICKLLGITYGQGYLLGRPVSADHIIAGLAAAQSSQKTMCA